VVQKSSPSISSALTISSARDLATRDTFSWTFMHACRLVVIYLQSSYLLHYRSERCLRGNSLAPARYLSERRLRGNSLAPARSIELQVKYYLRRRIYLRNSRHLCTGRALRHIDTAGCLRSFLSLCSLPIQGNQGNKEGIVWATLMKCNGVSISAHLDAAFRVHNEFT
jgi:hypothetical protein